MKAKYVHHRLNFKQPSGTSRGVLLTKDSWFLKLSENGKEGIGECSTIINLSPDLDYNIESAIKQLVKLINESGLINLDHSIFSNRPALKFAYEMAIQDLEQGGVKELYNSSFLDGEGIPINGLVWMGSKEFMYQQIKKLIENGYRCIKLKIAAIEFEEELKLLAHIREQFTENDMMIRVDANGGFSMNNVLEKLKRLSDYKLHSIEQPIKAGNIETMSELCNDSPLDIALDEELIGIQKSSEREELLSAIRPQYIILKPSLLGGFAASQEWISIAEKNNINWWVTSALEANIGLNAIAQWTATLNTSTFQGLGTGQLFTNNIESPLFVNDGQLYMGNRPWARISF